MSIILIFALLAILCFAAAAAGVPSRINLTALGLLFLTLYFVVRP
jgi:hypothetical protein